MGNGGLVSCKPLKGNWCWQVSHYLIKVPNGPIALCYLGCTAVIKWSSIGRENIMSLSSDSV